MADQFEYDVYLAHASPPKRDKAGRPLKGDATTLVGNQEKREIYRANWRNSRPQAD